MKRWIGYLFIPAFIGGFLAFPETIMSGFIAMWIVIASLFLLLLVFILLAYLFKWKRRKGSDELAVKISDSVAYIGSPGQGTPLTIRETPQGTRVEWAWHNYLLVTLVLGCFGPGMILLYLVEPETLNDDIPLPILALLILLVGLCCYFCIHYAREFFFNRPYLLLSASSIEYGKGKARLHSLHPSQIRRLSLRHHTYRTAEYNEEVPNYILQAETEDGKIHPLCISDREDQILSLLKLLHQKGYPLT